MPEKDPQTTPDGTREVTLSLLPTPGVIRQLVLLRGNGLPSLVMGGNPGQDVGDLLRMANNDVEDGSYTEGDYVLGGMVRIQGLMDAGASFSTRGEGPFFGMGTVPAGSFPAQAGDLFASLDKHEPTALWLVTDATGPQILVFPFGKDEPYSSAELIDVMAEMMVGEFCIESIDTLWAKAASNPFVPGWPIKTDKSKPEWTVKPEASVSVSSCPSRQQRPGLPQP